MNRYLIVFTVFLLFACKEDSTSNPEALLQQMSAIDDQIEELIQTSCSSANECIATAIGVKACGGPTRYIVHSDKTDQQKLDDLVTKYNELNTQYNQLTNAFSDCSIINPPPIDCVSGNCQEVISN